MAGRAGLTSGRRGTIPALRMAVDLRPAVHVTGIMLVGLGATMLLPAAVDFALGNAGAFAFLQSALITVFAGSVMALSGANPNLRGIDVRQGFVLTLVIWTLLPFFGALPLHIGVPYLSWTDAIFESVSGFTTTGSSMIAGLDSLPAGMHLWRGMLNWMGGLGIAFVAMIFLPVMRVGGMQFFRSEGFDTFGKVLPRAADIALALVRVYALLTLIFILVYEALGMSALDAVVHGMATIATGGFSTSDASFGKYAGLPEYAGAAFMIAAAVPYIRYVQLVNGNAKPLWRDGQVRAFLLWFAVAVAMVTLWRVATSEDGFEPALRASAFNLASIMTSTGFGSSGFGAWEGFPVVVAFIVGVIGGCSGSSCSALTVFRVQIVVGAMAGALRRIAAPSRVAPVKYEGRAVDADTINGVVLYVWTFMLLLFLGAVGIALSGTGTEAAVFGSWISLGNIGYSYGPIAATTGTFADYPMAAKWIMIFQMLAGRLGLLAFFVVALPRFWRS